MFKKPAKDSQVAMLEVELMSTSGWRRKLLLLAGVLAFALFAGCDSGGGDDSGGGGQTDEDTTEDPGEDDILEPEGPACVPACGTLVCGPDGCGGQCGTCDPGMECQAGQCAEPPPDCDVVCVGKTCGMVDTCNCGICTGGLVCVGGTCKAPMDCDEEGFTEVTNSADMDFLPDGGFSLVYQSLNAESAPFDVIVLDINTSVGGPTGPGVYDAAYTDFDSHGIFLYILAQASGGNYEKLFVPTEGKINVTSLTTEMGGTFTATADAVLLREATYNQTTNGVDFVPHGDTWCFDGLVMDAPIAQTMPDCVADGTGQMLGDNIADFQLQNCNGDWVNLHEKCANTEALWLVATAGW